MGLKRRLRRLGQIFCRCKTHSALENLEVWRNAAMLSMTNESFWASLTHSMANQGLFSKSLAFSIPASLGCYLCRQQFRLQPSGKPSPIYPMPEHVSMTFYPSRHMFKKTWTPSHLPWERPFFWQRQEFGPLRRTVPTKSTSSPGATCRVKNRPSITTPPLFSMNSCTCW